MSALGTNAWLPADFDEAAAQRFRRPFHTFLIKVASLCNLDCSYCYVYRSPDDSWKTKPKFLESAVAAQIGRRIQEHVAAHSLSDITIVLHGGEPLLLGAAGLNTIVDVISRTLTCDVHWGLQTNGTLLDEELINFFAANNFRIGISLDGSRSQNDRNRRYHNSNSAFDDTVGAIRRLVNHKDYRQVFGGVLIVVDLRNDPAEILETLGALGIGSANLILPDANYDSLPSGWKADGSAYGAWLCDFFDIWYERYAGIEIPYFEQIMSLMLGGLSTAEEIGALSVDLIVVDTNGDMEAVDTLKTVGRKATHLGLNVTSHSFDEALLKPAVYSRMSGFSALCKTCRECAFLGNCGGGYLPHRYSAAAGFINPSIYCQDLTRLFQHIRKSVFIASS
jgi:uncharacterized protein